MILFRCFRQIHLPRSNSKREAKATIMGKGDGVSLTLCLGNCSTICSGGVGGFSSSSTSSPLPSRSPDSDVMQVGFQSGIAALHRLRARQTPLGMELFGAIDGCVTMGALHLRQYISFQRCFLGLLRQKCRC